MTDHMYLPSDDDVATINVMDTPTIISVVPPGATVDGIVEVVLNALNQSDAGIVIDRNDSMQTKLIVYGLGKFNIGDLAIKVAPLPDRIGPVQQPSPPLPSEDLRRGRVNRASNIRSGAGLMYAKRRDALLVGTYVIILEDVKSSNGGLWNRVDVKGLEGFVYAELIEEYYDNSSFAFEAWPTEFEVITQRFGANPNTYEIGRAHV